MEKQLEFEHRLTATEDREKANTRRIDKLEKASERFDKITNSIHEMSLTMVRLVEQIKTTNESVQELKIKVDAIEQAPTEDFKAIKKTVITAIITGVIGAILGAILSLIIK